MNSATVLIALVAVLTALSEAAIPSFGQQSLTVERAKLRDSDFLINPRMGSISQTPNFTRRAADFNTYPLLAFPDVQSTIVLATVKFEKAIFTHYHPRATEVFTVLRGTFSVQIIFEGFGDVRVVDIMVPPGRSSVFPQGLPHLTTCMTPGNCVFSSILNSADPGLVQY